MEFFITRVTCGFELTADGHVVNIFRTVEAAADIAVRFAQDAGATSYSIVYP